LRLDVANFSQNKRRHLSCTTLTDWFS